MLVLIQDSRGKGRKLKLLLMMDWSDVLRRNNIQVPHFNISLPHSTLAVSFLPPPSVPLPRPREYLSSPDFMKVEPGMVGDTVGGASTYTRLRRKRQKA